MFYQTFLSPQVKQCAISTCKDGIYELPHELPNDLRLRILGNYEKSGKCPKCFVDTCKKTFEKQKLNFSLSALLVSNISLKYFVNDCRL